MEPGVHPDIIGAVKVPDGSVDPFRLTTANILAARLNGAHVITYHEVTGFVMNGNRITGVHTRSNKNGEKSTYYGRVTINACGISRLRVRAGERGGGLSGLTAAIESAKSGRKTAIVTTGQSALHFWSGSFEFLCSMRGEEVIERPVERAESLPDSHPYKKIGTHRTRRLLERVQPLLREAGINTLGSLDRNHYRLTPFGFLKPAWLTFDEYLYLDHTDDMAGKKTAIVNILSYLDFYPRYLSNGLRKLGVECVLDDVDIPELDVLRKSTTEMRSTNISRFLRNDAVDKLAREIDRVSRDCDAVIMSAVLGMFSDDPVRRLRQGVGRPIYFVATTPASVPGVRCQLSLRDYFIRLGGEFLPGDTVVSGTVRNHRLESIRTRNFGDMPVYADNFVISTGSFFGHGLIATIDRIYEPVLGLDLNVDCGRTGWYEKNVYDPQPYMAFGVVTDNRFRPSLKGETVENLFATGALLGGFNALKEGSGAGITLATALHAASEITR